MTLLLRSLLLCILASILWGCSSTPTKQNSSKMHSSALSSLSPQQFNHYKSALTSLKEQKPKSAEKTLKKLVSAQPTVNEIWINLALSQYHQKKYRSSKKTLSALLDRDKSVAQAYNILGLIAVQNGSFKKAERHYKKSIQLQPTYTNALYNMALLQDVYLQDIPKALNFYQQYLKIETEDQQTKDWVSGLETSLDE